ncbi:MAG: DUF2344 domain-containing protein [Oscillospiraceae bacterium]|nr:DUF2344 domain-containing protein [Oscillospiraceae bacterium]
MPRVLFEKTANAIWISHLDSMRLFQRMFKRAGLPLKHTQGFNPRPSVSIALPLSVGVESRCELLDFELDAEAIPCEEICRRLNAVSVAGLRVLQVYDNGRKIRDLALLDCKVMLEFDTGVPPQAEQRLAALFGQDSLVLDKKGKNGVVQQDIISMIRSLRVSCVDENTVCIYARICCQNPALNPTQLVAAIQKYLPDLAPDHARCSRDEIYDNNETVFR